MRDALKALVAGVALATFAAPAQAALVHVGTFSGQDCPGTGPGSGGFSDCWATQSGVVYQATTAGSPSVFKYNNGGAEDFSTRFPTIDGAGVGEEFSITFDAITNTLSFTYTPGAGDPELHYFSIKQANGYALFYDVNAILSGSIDLDPYFPRNPGYSHITFYDTGGAIPEPAVWGMMLVGFAGIGSAMRRRKMKPTVQFA